MSTQAPAVNREYVLSDSETILSKTDPKGNFTYVNLDCLNISGYAETELLGKHQSIMRHPDMPKAISEDFWKTLSAGKTWVGIMKNRTKGGNFYWVGRGFAVVAAEVRNLAQRSAGAAKEIKTLIGDSVDKVDIGSKLVDDAGQTMAEIVTSVKRAAGIMREITAASQEQSAGIEQVNQAITQMDETTQQNAALVEQAATAAASMQEQAVRLAQLVSAFKLASGGAGVQAIPLRSPLQAGPGRAPQRMMQLAAAASPLKPKKLALTRKIT